MVAYSVLACLPIFPDARTGFLLGQRVIEGERQPLLGSILADYRSLTEACWAEGLEDWPTFETTRTKLKSREFLSAIDVAAFRSYYVKHLS
jgi:hypothetical protein